ncbi:hypothetical protein [Pseudomonas sp. MWU16-30322]|uniref:hypothetical protein n=1 Tax=Pseudomonas sp. MWU16-30322 TaxID=2878092 RepID=UPI001CFA2A86|nr:hypothetical protein [Pseudomonas sp. MWU16-30322]
MRASGGLFSENKKPTVEVGLIAWIQQVDIEVPVSGFSSTNWLFTRPQPDTLF